MTPTEILTALLRFHRESSARLHLVPSENTMSLAARAAFLTDAVHRYSFPPDRDNTAWPGNGDLAAIEAAAVAGLREVFRAEHANVRPISGLNCMAVAVSALAEPGGTMLSISEADGGHAATRALSARLGVRWAALPYDRTRYAVDLDRLGDEASSLRGPVVVYLDQFMCLFPHDLRGLRDILGGDALIHYDGSHVLGLIGGGQFQDPLREGADSLGGSTHKSLPGPHKGVLLTDADHLAKKFDEHCGYWVSHHHPADVAALALTVAELRTDGAEYAARTVANARRLGAALAGHGIPVCAEEHGYTRSHQLWLDIRPVLDPAEASRRLLAAGVVVNAIEVPYLVGGVGLRLGVQEVTRLGFGSADIDELAEVFRRLLVDGEDPVGVAPVVADLRARYVDRQGEEVVDGLLAALVARSAEA